MGQSSCVEQQYGIADLANDTASLMDQLGITASHVVGLSMGGMIAQELALARPDLVRSLALVDTMAQADAWFRGLCDTFTAIRHRVADTPSFFETILPWFIGSRFFGDSDRAAWLIWLLRHTPNPQPLECFIHQIEAMRLHDAMARLASIRCPVLILTGAEDAIMPVRYARQMKEVMPYAELEFLDGIGHCLPLEMGREFDGRIGRFFHAVD